MVWGLDLSEKLMKRKTERRGRKIGRREEKEYKWGERERERETSSNFIFLPFGSQ